MTDIIWKNGDPWADLTDAVGEAKQATVLSENGTITILDLNGTEDWFSRIPGFHTMPRDYDRQHTIGVALTPCGMIILRSLSGEDTHMTSRIVLVLAGHRIEEAKSYYTTYSDLTPTILEHPETPCYALYCIKK